MTAGLQHAHRPAAAGLTSAPPGVLMRACACGGKAGPEGECDKCRDERAALQPKLWVNQPGDEWEREADRAADAVMAGGAAAVSPAAPGGVVRRRAAGAGPAAAPPIVHEALASPGAPLAAEDRGYFEPRFGHDFGRVRVHADARAAASADAVGARAYTVGRDVVFAAGQYASGTVTGRRLLAHELAHVVQQAGGGGPRVMRQACGHDGRGANCGAGGQARWQLVDIVTQEVTEEALDSIVVRAGLATHFPGIWARQVQTPPNPRKSGRERGFADGMKVRVGGTLRVEVVEVKSRNTRFGGGCRVAAREAAGYVGVLRPLAAEVVALSQKLAGVGGLRAAPGRLTADDRLVLRTAGVDLGNPATARAWRFYNSLQDRLGVTFTVPFTGFEADVNRDGAPGKSYPAGPPVLVPCRTRRGRPGTKTRQLQFQVNGDGGVSYGCSDTPCRDRQEEEERQRQRQPVAQPEAQPQIRTEEQPVAPTGQQDEPSEEQAPDSVVPIVLVGAGAAALTAAAIAAARRRAQRIAGERAFRLAQERAARNVIDLAERRAARAAARGAAGRVAGQVAGRAVAAASAAAAVFLLVSGQAEARIGMGPSPLEALYDSMTRNGTPPSPEMRELIESDPVLRQLAEQAGATGDVTPLQEALARRTMELIRDNPGEFTAEDLEILAQMSNAAGTGVAPETAAELRAAIDQARAGQTGTGAGGTGRPGGGTTGQGGVGTGGTTAGTPGAPGGLSEAVEDVDRTYPGLSPEVRGEFAAAPAAVRRLFDAMVRPGGGGPQVDDEAVRRFLRTAPVDLTDAEATTLIGQLQPVAGQSLDEILAALRTAVQSVRGEQPPAETGDAAAGEADDTRRPAEGGEEVPDEAADPAARQAEEAAEPQSAGDTGTGGTGQPDRVVAMLRAAIDSYTGWNAIPVGSQLIVGEFRGKPPGTEVGAYVYARIAAAAGGTIRVVAYVQLRVRRSASRSGERWTGTVQSCTRFVADNGRTAPGWPAGMVTGGTLVD